MIDLILLRKNRSSLKQAVAKKDPNFDIDRLIELDEQIRTINVDVESLRQRKNELAKKGQSGVNQALIEESKNVGKQLKDKEKELQALEHLFNDLYLNMPNIPDDDVPVGDKKANKEIKLVGTRPTFSSTVQDHMQLATQLGWLDFVQAATMASSNFVLYKGDGVRLVHALISLMLQHNAQHGFELILPPFLVNRRSLEISGNFPKFQEDVYRTQDDLFLIPTAEVCLANMYRDTIFMADDLPKRLTAATSCFRREAGGYGAAERGLIRLHQFEKVELFSYCMPENSNEELDYMLSVAEGLLKKLGLHYRVTLLATQDMSFQSAKTYDIEIWMPSQQTFIEVSSSSNCREFQARRGKVRYRTKAGEKTHYVHTLNASSLALPRLIAALIETYQQDDGTIALPDCLKKFYL